MSWGAAMLPHLRCQFFAVSAGCTYRDLLAPADGIREGCLSCHFPLFPGGLECHVGTTCTGVHTRLSSITLIMVMVAGGVLPQVCRGSLP